MTPARESALHILASMDREDTYLNIAYQNQMERAGAADAALVKELVYGVTTYRLALDADIRVLSSVRLKKIAPMIRNILRLGLYQLKFLDKIPASAAVNESVKLARKYGHGGSAGFVNAILRSYLRSAPAYSEETDAQRLSRTTSHPLWLVEAWLSQYGKAFTEGLLSANNARPPMTIRCNTRKIGRDALAAQLAADGMTMQETPLSPVGLFVEGGGNLERHPAYQAGLFTIQDQSAQLPALALAPLPGSRVLDLCAAPGGKTTQLAECMDDTGEVLAFDIHAERCRMIAQAAHRLGHTSIRAAVMDAAQFDPRLENTADRVLLDVPCSGLGILRRKPDIKYRMTPEKIVDIRAAQAAILRTGARYVKPGGTLVYSTCTINEAENDDVVDAFLADNPTFVPDPVPQIPGMETGRMTLYPHVHQSDGFFICKLRRMP